MALNPMNENGASNRDSQEGITVAIRMRPLNNAEENNKRIWKVLPKYSSVAQTTRDGKPLPERITGRTFFTFDKTFAENTNNKQVYDSVAKGIVNSVVDGLNGTIFAYGQTSSGKTYTMQGAGNLEQGMGGEGGVVHMAANDIFSQIAQKQQRNFLVRVSFLEIYNEEVRDLLGDTSQTLKIREDPRQGVFVESQEEIVTDFNGLLKILVRGDKSRTFASTGMNERSSRSHTILRVTIESREKESNPEHGGEDSDDMDFENQNPASDGAVRISTLNLVDLAGSESVRHTGATGERQKEGGLINQSLLTLSRVIVALGAPNQMHINFRDSKLTRILQPSLSGNARMAVICCATPSELYLEETRSTLQFASRAKLVKTNAQVNEVLDERSMIRRLQRELAEAKRNQSGPGQGRVRDLEAQVASAGTQALEAKEKLDRLKASILNTGYIIDHVPNIDAGPLSDITFDVSKKRRKSDGLLLLGHSSPSKPLKVDTKSPKTAPRKKRSKVLKRHELDVQQELKLVQEALATRNNYARDLNLTLNKYSEEMTEKNSDIDKMKTDNLALCDENKKALVDVIGLKEMVASLKQALDSSVRESEQALVEKDSTIMESFEKLQQALRENEDAKKDNSDLLARLDEIEEEKSKLQQRILSLEKDSRQEKELFEVKSNDLEASADTLKLQLSGMEEELQRETDSKLQLEESLSETKGELERQMASRIELEETVSKMQLSMKDSEDALKTVSDEKIEMESELRKSHDAMDEMVENAENLKAVQETLIAEKNSMEALLISYQQKCIDMEHKMADAEEQISRTQSEYEAASNANNSTSLELESTKEKLKDALTTISTLQQDCEKAARKIDSIKLEKETIGSTMRDLEYSVNSYKEEIRNLQKILSETKAELEQKETAFDHVSEEKKNLETTLNENESMLMEVRADKERAIEEFRVQEVMYKGQIDDLRESLTSANSKLNHQELQILKISDDWSSLESNMKEIEEANAAKISTLETLRTDKERATRELEEQLQQSKTEVLELQDSLTETNSKLEEQERKFAQLLGDKEALETHLEEMEDINTSKVSTLQELHAEKERSTQELEEQLQQSKAAARDLQESLDITKAQLNTLSIDKETLQLTIQQLEDSSEEKNSTLNELRISIQKRDEVNKSLETQVVDLQGEVERLQATLNNVEAVNMTRDSVVDQLRDENNEAKINMAEKKTRIEELQQELTHMESRVGVLSSDIEIHNNEIEGLLTNLMQVTSEKQELESSYVELKHSCESLVTENETLHDRCSCLEQENKEFKEDMASMKVANEALSEKNNTLEELRQSLVSSRTKSDDVLAEYEEEVTDLSEQINNVLHEAISSKERNHDLHTACDNLEREIEEKNTVVLQLQTEVETLELTHRELCREYDEEITALSEQINIVFIEATSFEERNNELQAALESLELDLEDKNAAVLQLQTKIENLGATHDDTIRSLRDCEAERDEAKNEVENMTSSREAMIQNLRDREAERDEAMRELNRLYDENRDLTNNSLSKEKENEFRVELADLKAQNLELTHLLASVNESEERLRTAVATAENNCMIKTQKLDDAEYRIAQFEEELKNSHITDVEISEIQATKVDLCATIENLKKEKGDIEQALREENEARCKLQRQMGEEQRVLIQEGEKMMSDLRNQLEECKEKLSQSESEAYNARKHIEEINDERNRLEEKYIEASTQLNSSESSKHRLDTQITTLQSQLNDAKSENYELNERFIDLKEKMRRATRDSEKAISKSESASSELANLRRKVSSLENLNETNQTENSKLRKKLKEACENENLITSLQNEIADKQREVTTAKDEISKLKLRLQKEFKPTDNTARSANQDEVNSMSRKLKEMTEAMEQKDKRIKKLEAVRLTKDQLAHIKKMKADNSKYEKKCSKLQSEIDRLQKEISNIAAESQTSSDISKYEKKCLKLEREIARLQQKIDSTGAGTASSEISELRFDKEALERKLRKFATHCQRLEDEKAGMADALQSCNIDIEGHGNDIGEAVVHLCDKFASIEESHSKLLNNTSHEKEKQSLQREIEKLSLSEKMLTEKVTQYQHEIAELEEKLDNANIGASTRDSEEHREKIRYLEHENLQLLHNMKSVKKQLHAAREEIETLRVNSVDLNPTTDFGILNAQMSRTESGQYLTKENSDTMELTNLAAACTKNSDSETKPRRSTRKTKKRNVLSDNTNSTRAEERTDRSLDKRQKLSRHAETKRIADKEISNQIPTPGLGETSSHDTENTGECQQS